MILPRFTIRRILLLMASIAVLSMVVSYAVRGHQWALAICVALGALALVFVVHAVFFFGGYVLAGIGRAMFSSAQAKKPASPFAADVPAPRQLVAAEEIE